VAKLSNIYSAQTIKNSGSTHRQVSAASIKFPIQPPAPMTPNQHSVSLHKVFSMRLYKLPGLVVVASAKLGLGLAHPTHTALHAPTLRDLPNLYGG
jgi:hypothetical protein